MHSNSCQFTFNANFYLHGVVKVADLAYSLPWCGAVEAGVVDVADNTLNPGQGTCRWQGFVWKVTYKKRINTLKPGD